jgi:polyisoprenoid-binding protein YceI
MKMKKIAGALLILFTACELRAAEEKAVVAAPSLPEPRTLAVDLKESQVRWVGKKVTGQHSGTLKIKSGEVNTRGETLTGARFEFDMTTIADEDLTDAKLNAKLTNHLKSDDFFSVDKHPTATLVITEARAIEPKGTYDVKGNLTLKGITKPVAFPLKVEIVSGKARAAGTVKLDRTLWDVRYGSGKFFKKLGDKLIYDEFEVSFDVTSRL